MLELVSESGIEKYLKVDGIGRLLSEQPPAFKTLTGTRWLEDSVPKRYIYDRMYGAILKGDAKGQRVLDIGGGFSSLTPVLAANCDYHLLEIGAHETPGDVAKIERDLGPGRMILQDWWSWNPTMSFDWVIANDLFPNVDQRLELFLEKFLPCCRRLSLSLTYYNKPRFYQVKRVDADEMLWYLAWNSESLKTVLNHYRDRISGSLDNINWHDNRSVYPNGRQVLLLEMAGK